MKGLRIDTNHRRLTAASAVLLAALVLAFLLVSCGGEEPTAQVIIVSATFTAQPQVVVVTATFTPTPAEVPTEASGADVVVSVPEPTLPPLPTASSPPIPSATPLTTWTPLPSQPTEAPQPTAKPQTPLNAYFVAYTSFAGSGGQGYGLWGMRGDGADVFKIIDDDSEPVFSPDGNRFVFYQWTDGLHIWDLVKQTSTHFVHDGNAAYATWSPDGKRIAYSQLLGQPWIRLVNPDGSADQNLTQGYRPSWALKGGFIAYDTCEANKCGIFRINPDGGGKRQLTDDSGGGAAVSPNGKKIAYWSQADGDFEVYVINADGSGKKQLTQNRGNDALPAWSPGGKKIYYLSDRDGQGWAVMVMNANGGGQRKVVDVGTSADPGRGWQYQRIAVTWN